MAGENLDESIEGFEGKKLGMLNHVDKFEVEVLRQGRDHLGEKVLEQRRARSRGQEPDGTVEREKGCLFLLESREEDRLVLRIVVSFLFYWY